MAPQPRHLLWPIALLLSVAPPSQALAFAQPKQSTAARGSAASFSMAAAGTHDPSGSSRPASTRARPMTEADLLRLQWVADPQISPDGSRVAFTRVSVDTVADDYRASIWLIDAKGGEPRPLTTGPRDGQPRWAPDGHALAFVRAPEGKPGQIYLLSMSGGEPTQLTRLKGGAAQPAWSPDSKRIAFSSSTNPKLDADTIHAKPKHDPGRVVTKPVFRQNGAGFIDFDHQDHVWVADAAGGTPHQLTTGRFDEGAPQWSRDGRWIYFLSDRRKQPWFEPEDNNLYAIAPNLKKATDGPELKIVIDIKGPVGQFDESGDGRIVSIGNLQPEHVRSYDQDDLLLAAGGWPRHSVRNLTSGYDFDVGAGIIADQHPPRGGGHRPLAWSADGRSVITVVGRQGAALLARVDAENGSIAEITDSHHEVISGTCTPDARIWAITAGDVSRPCVLYRLDAATRELIKLWDPNESLWPGLKLAAAEEFWYPSFDGKQIEGWIMRPVGFVPSKRYPMVLEIHGGPHVPYGMSFFHEFQVLAGAGYVVLYTNPRGSTTYGQDFGNVIQYNYPGDDARDLLAAVDVVLKRGYVDAKRLGVTGGSGGGLLTNWIITQTPRFAAAVTDRCVSEWASFYYSADFTLFTPTWFRKPPFEDIEESIRRSPVAYAARITTPLMIIHSEDDWRTPIGQGEAMFRALKQQKKTAVMVRFPGENHELSRSGVPSRRVQRLQHLHKWFDRYLLGKPIHDYDE